MGIFSFFKPKAEMTIKFDHEIAGTFKPSAKIPPICERILNKQPANPSLTSEATGRVHFKPELLGLGDGKKLLEFDDDVDVVNESIPVYQDGDSLKGSVYVKVNSGKSISHYGIKVEFFGILDFPGGLKPSITFCQLSSSLSAEGQLDRIQEFPFEFKRVEMAHESYNGRHLQVKYFVKVNIKRGLGGDICSQRSIWVKDYTPTPPPPPMKEEAGWQLEVGLEDQLHINFTSAKTEFSLNENIEGELHFSLVNLKIKSADLSLVRREMVGSHVTDQEVLQRYQIIDGSPARYDTIPFALPLKNLMDLTPSLRGIEKVGSVLYFVNLIIYDVEGRRYFKQQEIQLYREHEDLNFEKSLHLLLSK